MLAFRDIKRDSVLKGLKTTSHFFAHRATVSKSELRSSAASVGSSITIYRLVSSAKRRILEPKSFTMSFMYSKNNKGPGIDPVFVGRQILKSSSMI